MSTTTATSEYLVFCRSTGWEKILSPADIENAMKQFYDWFERLGKKGKMRSGHRLAAESKIVSRPKAVMDGPFAESKEAIAGYWFIQAATLEEAVEIAKGNPCLDYGVTLEVRPIHPRSFLESGRAWIAEAGSKLLPGYSAWNTG